MCVVRSPINVTHIQFLMVHVISCIIHTAFDHKFVTHHGIIITLKSMLYILGRTVDIFNWLMHVLEYFQCIVVYATPTLTHYKKRASKIRKYHNHTLQTNPQHREEETQITNSPKSPGRPLRLSNWFFLPLQDDCKTRKVAK